MSSESVILTLLQSAELCYERDRHRMAKLALAQIMEHIEDGVEVTDETWERVQKLDGFYEDDEDYTREPSDPDEPNGKGYTICPKCVETPGKYGPNGRLCFACKGKGKQDEADRRRNAAYWAHQKKIRELRRSKPLADF